MKKGKKKIAAKKTVMTLVFPVKDGKVWMSEKKRGIGIGYWNGYGGRVEPGETIEQAAKRELFEETGGKSKKKGCGLRALRLERMGAIIYRFADEPEKLLEVHVYLCPEFSGRWRATQEMGRMRSFCWDKLPLDRMWPADRKMMPLLRQGISFHGSVLYKNERKIVRACFRLAA